MPDGLKYKSDVDLMQEIKAGNMLAFDAVYNKYSSRIYKFALSLLKLPEEAENIVQDVFMNLWINREKVEIISSVRYYVFTSAYHSSISVIRKKLKETDYINFLFSIQEPDKDTVSLQIEYEELDSKLRKAIDELPARQKEVYQLHKSEGLKYAEISNRLGITVNTVENHMSKALSTLRKKLGNYSLPAILFWFLFV